MASGEKKVRPACPKDQLESKFPALRGQYTCLSFFHDCQDVKGLSPLEAGCIRTKVMEDGEFVNFICENFSFTCNSATIGT